MDVGVHPAKKSVWNQLPSEVDQIWAEAYLYWAMGSPCISEGDRGDGKGPAGPHRESSGKEGLILDFLDREIPSDWDSLSRQQRQMFWNGNLKLADGTELVPGKRSVQWRSGWNALAENRNI